VDPRPFAVGEIAEAFRKYTHLSEVLPALGYGDQQVADLRATLDAADCDVVVAGTPIDLQRVVQTQKPVVRARYEYEEAGGPGLGGFVRQRFGSMFG
jgi:predicted GTPase